MAAPRSQTPLCGNALGTDWMDRGTLAVTRRDKPGPVCAISRDDLLHSLPPAPPPPEQDGVPMIGSVLAPVGLSTVVRIPIPGTKGLAVALSPQNWKGKSTSVLFFQDSVGKRTLRLDFGPNKSTGKIDYHWNANKTYAQFGIADHTPATPAEGNAFRAIKVFKYLGRSLLLVGAVTDAYSIVVADRPLRRGVQVAGGWAGAWAGCEVVGASGAWAGTFGGPWGIAIGAGVGCIAGGWGGYQGGERLATVAYEWAANTVFTELPEADAEAEAEADPP